MSRSRVLTRDNFCRTCWKTESEDDHQCGRSSVRTGRQIVPRLEQDFNDEVKAPQEGGGGPIPPVRCWRAEGAEGGLKDRQQNNRDRNPVFYCFAQLQVLGCWRRRRTNGNNGYEEYPAQISAQSNRWMWSYVPEKGAVLNSLLQNLWLQKSAPGAAVPRTDEVADGNKI